MSNVLLAMQRQDAQYLYSGPLGSMNFVPGVPNLYSALSRAAERVFDERLTKVSVDFDIYTEEDVMPTDAVRCLKIVRANTILDMSVWQKATCQRSFWKR